MTASPARALLWEIWQRQRSLAIALVAVTVVGRTLEAIDPSPFTGVLRMVSFVLLFEIFCSAEASDGGLGRFPPRLFVLPISSLRLAAIPAAGGIVAVVLLYLVWIDPQRTGGFAMVLFNATLFAALLVSCQTAVWTLERLGPFRLIVVGLLVVAAFLVSLHESNAPPRWATTAGLTALTAAFGALSFVLLWRYITWMRAGASQRTASLGLRAPADLLPRRRAAFRSAAAAHFWFEWRSSGLVLPLVTAAVVLVVLLPLALWVGQEDAAKLLFVALAAPIVLAIPIGIGFAQPAFLSEDLSIPAFVAVRPLSDEDLVATKVRVAGASAAASWLLVIGFATIALPISHYLDLMDAALITAGGIVLTWRFLVVRMWTGLAGQRSWHIRSVVMTATAVIAAFLADIDRLARWLMADPAHLAALEWIGAAAVVLKYAAVARVWRIRQVRYGRQYLVVWIAGTSAMLMFGLFVLPDLPRPELIVLGALLTVPVARVGLACQLLARNRHR